MCRSEPQMPQARVLTSNSPWAGTGSAIEATSSFFSRMTTAFMEHLLLLWHRLRRRGVIYSGQLAGFTQPGFGVAQALLQAHLRVVAEQAPGLVDGDSPRTGEHAHHIRRSLVGLFQQQADT